MLLSQDLQRQHILSCGRLCRTGEQRNDLSNAADHAWFWLACAEPHVLLIKSVGNHGKHSEKLGRASLPSSERLVFSIIVVQVVRAGFFTVCICGDRKVWRCQMMSC